MAFEKHKNDHNLPVIAAADTPPRRFLTPGGSSSLLAVLVATNSVRPHWFSGQGTTASGVAIPAQEQQQVVKCVAVASVGCGAEVAIGSSNGALSPAALVAASGHWAVGISLSSAGAGELFSVDICPRKV